MVKSKKVGRPSLQKLTASERRRFRLWLETCCARCNVTMGELATEGYPHAATWGFEPEHDKKWIRNSLLPHRLSYKVAHELQLRLEYVRRCAHVATQKLPRLPSSLESRIYKLSDAGDIALRLVGLPNLLVLPKQVPAVAGALAQIATRPRTTLESRDRRARIASRFERYLREESQRGSNVKRS